MSMNINLKAVIVGDFVINSKSIKKKIHEMFDCVQTPTNITKQILKSNNPYDEYVNFIKNRFDENQEIFIYAEDDYFEENEPVDSIIDNAGDEHIKTLNKFISDHNGWELIWFEL